MRFRFAGFLAVLGVGFASAAQAQILIAWGQQSYAG